MRYEMQRTELPKAAQARKEKAKPDPLWRGAVAAFLFVWIAIGVAILWNSRESGHAPRVITRNRALEWLQVAAVAQSQGDWKAADQLYDEARSIDPALRGIDYQQAVSAYQQRQFDRARNWLESSLQRGEEVVAAHNLLGVMLGVEGRHEAALAEFELAKQADGSDPQAYFNASESLRLLSRPADAEKELLRATELRPDETLYAFKRRMAIIDRGNDDSLLSSTREMLSLTPPTPDWIMTAAAISLQRKNFGDAAAMLHQARQAMNPMLFYAMLQDPLFTRHVEHKLIAPFFDVRITEEGTGQVIATPAFAAPPAASLKD